jgi:ABC-2 type transport system permease protein
MNMTWLKTYPTLLKAYYARSIEYRGQIIIWILSSVLPLIMLMVWLTIAGQQGAPIGGYDAAGFISYYLMVTLFRRITGVWIIWDMDNDIREGALSPLLLKPLNPMHYHFAAVIAGKPLQTLIVLPPIAVASILLGAHYDLSLLSLLCVSIALCGGMMIEFLVQAIIGTFAFWITQATAVAELWFWIRSLLSGWVIPLALFPAALIGPLTVLPFRYTLSFPIEIILGRLPIDQIALGFGIELFWIAVFFLAFRWLWRRGLKLYGAVGA